MCEEGVSEANNPTIYRPLKARERNRERNTPPSHLLLPFLSMYSSVTAQLTPHSHFCLFTPLCFTSFAPIHVSLSPGSQSPSLSGKRGTGIVHLRVMELWQADPSALSPGRAAVPGLCDAYLPIHTSTQKRQECTYLHTCMHTFIDPPREHTCALTHTSTLTAHVHVCV